MRWEWFTQSVRGFTLSYECTEMPLVVAVIVRTCPDWCIHGPLAAFPNGSWGEYMPFIHPILRGRWSSMAARALSGKPFHSNHIFDLDLLGYRANNPVHIDPHSSRPYICRYRGCILT